MATLDRHGIDHGPFSGLRNKNLEWRVLTAEEKEWLGGQIRDRKATAPELSRRYNLPVSTLYNYSRPDRSNVHSFKGHPSLVDDVAKAELVEELIEKKLRISRTESFREFKRLMCAAEGTG